MREAEITFIEKIKVYLKRYEGPHMKKAEAFDYSAQQYLGEIIYDSSTIMKHPMSDDLSSLAKSLANILLRYRNNELNKSVKVRDQLKQALENHNEDGSKKTNKKEKEEVSMTETPLSQAAGDVCIILTMKLASLELNTLVAVEEAKSLSEFAIDYLKRINKTKKAWTIETMADEIWNDYVINRPVKEHQKMNKQEENFILLLKAFSLPLPDSEEQIPTMMSATLDAKENNGTLSLPDIEATLNEIKSKRILGENMEAAIFKFLYRSSVRGNTNMEIYRRGKKIKEQAKELVRKKGDWPYLCDLSKETINCFLSIFVDENGADRHEADMEQGIVYIRLLFKTTDRQDIVELLEKDLPVAELAVRIREIEESRLKMLSESYKPAPESTFDRNPYGYALNEESVVDKFDIKEHIKKEHIKNSIADRGLTLKPATIVDMHANEMKSSEEPAAVSIPSIDKWQAHYSISMTMHREGHWDKGEYLQNKVAELNMLLVMKLIKSGLVHDSYLEEVEKIADFSNNFAIIYSYAIGLGKEWSVEDIVDRAWMAYCDTHM